MIRRPLFPPECALLDFEYRLIRSNRRSLGVSVRDGLVIVRAPRILSRDKIEQFLMQHQGWILKKIAEQTMIADRYESVRHYRTVLLSGTMKQLRLGEVRNFESESVLCLKDISFLRRWVEKNYADSVYENIYCLGKRAGLMPESVQVRDFKAKWGSCDQRKTIKINWRILFLPPQLQEYVLIHELCHLKYLDHSPLFWNKVAEFCPDYKIRKQQLKSFSFLTELYRN